MRVRLSENRALAWCVLGLCVLLSISLSGGLAMRDMRLEAQDTFFQGAARDGAGIDRDLDERAANGLILAEIAGRLAVDAQEVQRLRDACGALVDAQLIEAQHKANLLLEAAVQQVYALLEARDLQEDERLNASFAYREIRARADMIRRDPYNIQAREFNESIARFPANIIAGLTGIDSLQPFE